MPSKSEAQQRLMGMALAAKRGKGHFSGKVKEVAEGMTEKQLHDFAATKHEGLPEKKAAVELIKWAMGNAPQLHLPGGGGMIPNARPYYGPTSGPGVVNMGKNVSRLGNAGKLIGGKVLPGLGAAAGAAGAYDRFKNKDYLGAAIDGVGALGSAGSMIPGYGLIGTGVSLGTTALNAYRDNRKAKQMTQQQPAVQQPALTQASPMSGSTGEWTQETPQQPNQPQTAQQQPTQAPEPFVSFAGGEYGVQPQQPGQVLGNPQGVSIVKA